MANEDQIITAAKAAGLKADTAIIGDIDSLLRSVQGFKINESQILMRHCQEYADEIKAKSPQAARQLIIAKGAIYDLMNAELKGDGQRRWKYYTQAMDAIKQARQIADQSVDKAAGLKASPIHADEIEGILDTINDGSPREPLTPSWWAQTLRTLSYCSANAENVQAKGLFGRALRQGQVLSRIKNATPGQLASFAWSLSHAIDAEQP